MIKDSQADRGIIKRRSYQALMAWFRQAERLRTAKCVYRLRGGRFLDFARRIGITDQSTAYGLVRFYPYKQAILKQCAKEAKAAAKAGRIYQYPGWENAYLQHKPGHVQRSGRYWLTPPAFYAELDREFNFDFDPCPYPRPPGWDALTMEWGQSNYVNAPFRREDSLNGRTGPIGFIRKGIIEQQKGKNSVFALPVYDYVALLLQAGAEIRPVGRMPFLDIDGSGRTAPHPPSLALFILRGRKK
jgi:hypothetical protein